MTRTSHTVADESSHPPTSLDPSFDQEMQETVPFRSKRPFSTFLPDKVSQIITDLSLPPLARNLPHCEKEREMTGDEWPMRVDMGNPPLAISYNTISPSTNDAAMILEPGPRDKDKGLDEHARVALRR